MSQVYDTVYSKAERSNKFVHYQRGYYNEELVGFEDFEKQLDQNAPEHTLQTKIELARFIEKEKKFEGEFGNEEYTLHS